MSDPLMDAKTQALKTRGVLNSHPETVTAPVFDSHPFFDRRDVVQVKYEMVRQVQKDGAAVTDAARECGFSRVAFYQAQTALEQEGLAGLVPQKRGPKGGHKLTPEIIDALFKTKAHHPDWSAKRLTQWLREERGVSVHLRSVERVLAGRQKKRR